MRRTPLGRLTAAIHGSGVPPPTHEYLPPPTQIPGHAYVSWYSGVLGFVLVGRMSVIV